MDQNEQNTAAPASDKTIQPAKKSNKTAIIVVIVIVLIIICLGVVGGIYLVGKNALDQAAQQIENSVNNDSIGQESTNNGSDNNLDSEDSTGGSEDQPDVSLDGKLPAGFPSDVPIYPGAEIAGSTTSEKEYGVVLSTTDQEDKAYSFYKSALASQGWSVGQEVDFGIKGFNAKKGSREVTVGTFGDETGTTITISVTR